MIGAGGFVSFQLLSEGVILPHWVALVFTGSIFAGIAYAYRSHGLSGVAVVSTQVMAIMAVQLSTKLVLQTGFVYPTCIASLHFLCVWLASWAVERRSGAKDGLLLMDLKSSGYDNAEWYVKRILPIAVLQTLNVVLSSQLWSLRRWALASPPWLGREWLSPLREMPSFPSRASRIFPRAAQSLSPLQSLA